MHVKAFTKRGEASMKVPPKRKGNRVRGACIGDALQRLNESPSEKEGKSKSPRLCVSSFSGLNESPSEKEGKSRFLRLASTCPAPQ